MVQSIKKDGVINPITVSKTEIDKYVIVAGRRRFKACKILRLKEIPVRIQSEPYDESDKQRIALIENLHRKDLSDTEKANGILAVYTSAGYQSEDVIRLMKYLENNDYQPGKTDRNLILGKHSLTKSNIKSKREHYTLDEQFLDVVDSIGYSPNTQYKYLQIVVKLDPSILKEAEEKGLSINKKIMLTNAKLIEYPNLQKYLIDKIANQSEITARTIIAGTIRELGEGTLVKDEKSYQQLKDNIKSQKNKNGYPLKFVRRYVVHDGNTEYTELKGSFIHDDEIIPIITTVDLKSRRLISSELDDDEYRKLNIMYTNNITK